jgi:hypothetical protein
MPTPRSIDEAAAILQSYTTSTTASVSYIPLLTCTATATTDYSSTNTILNSTQVQYYWLPRIPGVAEGCGPTQAERQAKAARRHIERQRQLEQQVALEHQAEERAVCLLQAVLTPAQVEEFSRNRCFTVIGKNGKRRYRIWSTAIAYNIELIDDKGRPIEQLCAHLDDTLPVADSLLAQKLWLEHDEDGFRRIANIRRLAA